MLRTLVFSSLASVLLVGALGAGSLGCSASTAGSDPAAVAASVPGSRIAPVAVNAKSGRVKLIADALSTVPLGDDQRAQIEQLASDADARHAAAGGARADIMVAVAAQIEAGQIDRAALKSKIDAAAESITVTRPADQLALQHLHALLTPEQRGAVADAIVAHRKAMHAEHPHHAQMEKWATDLSLTESQRAQIVAILATQWADHHGDFKGMHEHGKHFLDSFRSDTLTFPAPEDAHARATAMADHFLGVAEAVLPILTPAQRSVAAAKLRERAVAGAGNEDAPLSE
jgi:Spy/CpxP family protein refolding chaperone